MTSTIRATSLRRSSRNRTLVCRTGRADRVVVLNKHPYGQPTDRRGSGADGPRTVQPRTQSWCSVGLDVGCTTFFFARFLFALTDNAPARVRPVLHFLRIPRFC